MRLGSVMLSRGFSRAFAHSGRQSLQFIQRERKLPNFAINSGVTVLGRRCVSTSRPLWTEQTEPAAEDEEYHSIITNTERGRGPADKHEFQAETRKLLDIVARSLYSEKEVFIRELISNCSDALEKLRYMEMTGAEIEEKGQALEIHIQADDDKKTLTIQDTGIGMTKEELIENLGTIAKSGSKAFLEQVQNTQSGGAVDKNIIGQFGVGFYSAFMVGQKLDVYTRSYKPDAAPLKWTSDGLGSYEITEAEGVKRGTKVVVHLKGDCYDFAKEETIKEIIKKYSNFVGVPIYVNGKKANMIQALWTMETRDITADMHEEFYRFISNAYDKPRYSLHYKADAPINIRALFYVPDYKPTMYDMSRETDMTVTLYSRKVMILAKANHILPKWLRFLKGVVDSEDIPLNLSRELLQDSSLIRKIRQVLTNRVIKFFLEKAKKDPASYLDFYEAYGLFMREGIVTTPEQDQREEISRLLRFESSRLEPGEKTSLDEYSSRLDAGDRRIYYFSAPSRELAETSPYMEAMKKKDIEVLYCYEPYDELVLMNLGEFQKKTLKSIENEMSVEEEEKSEVEGGEGSLSSEETSDLLGWMRVVLGSKVTNTKATHRLESHPCVITVAEMGAARHFLRTSLAGRSEEERYRMLQPTLEVNPKHPIITKLHKLKGSDPDLARLLTEQIFYNAMIAAGLVEDPRGMLSMLNSLLEKTLEKH